MTKPPKTRNRKFEPEILLDLADGVSMTTKGLLKRCAHCDLLMPLESFPEDRMRVFKRGKYCTYCNPVLDGAKR